MGGQAPTTLSLAVGFFSGPSSLWGLSSLSTLPLMAEGQPGALLLCSTRVPGEGARGKENRRLDQKSAEQA